MKVYLLFVVINIIILMTYKSPALRGRSMTIAELLLNVLLVVAGPLGTLVIIGLMMKDPAVQKKVEDFLNSKVEIKK
jgi:type IV secretory pathway VirB2 component (pilin)